MSARFVFSGLQLPEGEDPLGIWEVRGSRLEAFAAGEPVQGLVWLADLPEDLLEARSLIRRRRRAVEIRWRQLAAVEQRLTRLASEEPLRLTVREREAELLEEITALRRPLATFDARDEQRGFYDRIYQECDALLTQFRQLVQLHARVETRVGHRSVAVTHLSWSGEYETTALDRISHADVQVHLEAVRLALASRRALLRLVVVVVSGALKLALKAQIPGGQILLFPAVYAFVRDVLRELEAFPDGVLVR